MYVGPAVSDPCPTAQVWSVKSCNRTKIMIMTRVLYRTFGWGGGGGGGLSMSVGLRTSSPRKNLRFGLTIDYQILWGGGCAHVALPVHSC